MSLLRTISRNAARQSQTIDILVAAKRLPKTSTVTLALAGNSMRRAVPKLRAAQNRAAATVVAALIRAVGGTPNAGRPDDYKARIDSRGTTISLPPAIRALGGKTVGKEGYPNINRPGRGSSHVAPKTFRQRYLARVLGGVG